MSRDALLSSLAKAEDDQTVDLLRGTDGRTVLSIAKPVLNPFLRQMIAFPLTVERALAIAEGLTAWALAEQRETLRFYTSTCVEFVRPHGGQREVTFTLPIEVQPIEAELRAAGASFEVEYLPTGVAHFEILGPDEEVLDAVLIADCTERARLLASTIRKAHARWAAKRGAT